MSKLKLFLEIILLLVWIPQRCSSVTDLPPILDCGPEIQVSCNITETEPLQTDSGWIPNFCYHRAANNTEIGFKYSKPSYIVREVQRFEIRIYNVSRISMNDDILEDIKVKNTNTLTKCRYKNLKPAIYRIYIRAITSRSGGRQMNRKALVIDIPLIVSKGSSTVKKNTTVPETKPLASRYQESMVTGTRADNSTTFSVPIVSDKYSTNPTAPTFPEDNASKLESKLRSKHGSKLGSKLKSKIVAPTFSDVYTAKDMTSPVSDDYSTKIIVPDDPAETLMIALLITMVAVVSILLAGIYWRHRIQRSISQRDDVKPCSDLQPDQLSKTTSQNTEGQDTSTSACDESYVSLTKPEGNDKEVCDSGFDSTKDSVETSVSRHYKENVFKPDEDSVNNSGSLCDISAGNFVADALVWADMDRDLSPSVCTIASVACEDKQLQSSTRRGNFIRCSHKGNIREDSINAQVEIDIAMQKNKYSYEYIPQAEEHQYNGNTKHNHSALFQRYPSMKVLPNRAEDVQIEYVRHERERLLATTVDHGKCDKCPMFLSPSLVESAETLHLSVSDEVGWINNKYFDHLADTRRINGHCNSGFKDTNLPVYVLDDGINDIISFGEISI